MYCYAIKEANVRLFKPGLRAKTNPIDDYLVDFTTEELNDILKQAPLLIKDKEEKVEIINLATSRELNRLKKRIWKFYHK